MNQSVYIVLLNWNGWGDTIACLESVFGLQDVSFKVIVCDNDSGDGSLECIQQWASGRLRAVKPSHSRLARLQEAGSPENLKHRTIMASELGDLPFDDASELTIIDNQANLGFAAGNNTGIRYALAQKDMSHVWLLNNDTLVEPCGLRKMLDRSAVTGQRFVCGSRIMFYDNPSVIQAIGGNSYNPWTGNASQSLGRYLPENTELDVASYESALDYVCGASMLVPRRFLHEVGLMQPDYFLYYEEIDWITRASPSFKNCVAIDSVVYHKEGSSIGSASFSRRSSALSEFYMFRNKLRYTRRFHWYALPTCYLSSWLQFANRIRQKRFKNALVIAATLLGFRAYGS
ncbi:MAG: glycosyltransferase family 2 protein [Pseudomonadota bacterium]